MLKCCQELVAGARGDVEEITWAQAGKELAAGALMIDVREPGELEEGVVPGAFNIPRGLVEFRIQQHPQLQNLSEAEVQSARLMLFCATGGRAALAARSLKQMGFERVCSIAGGFKLRDS